VREVTNQLQSNARLYSSVLSDRLKCASVLEEVTEVNWESIPNGYADGRTVVSVPKMNSASSVDLALAQTMSVECDGTDRQTDIIVAALCAARGTCVAWYKELNLSIVGN